MKEDNVTGVLKMLKKGAGVLRLSEYSFRKQSQDVFVPPNLIRDYRISQGATIKGMVEQGPKGPVLKSIESLSGLTPDEFKSRKPYTALTAIDPSERFNLAASGDTSMRIVDLIAPIGKGTRGLIVSPPKAGKTMMMEKIAKAIQADDPQTRIIVLLVDERPEEVTHFRRAVEAEVLYSSSDQTIQEHVELVEMTLAHIRTELECNRNVVVLVDSLTRMGRAFNLRGSRSKKTLSGGLDANALEFPRRFFGLARNIENGGSVTIIATALIDTGSRMDNLIFEEFKGTGNSEIVLDRSLAERYVYPAINIAASGTRKEEQLYKPEEISRTANLRRALVGLKPIDAMESLLGLVQKHPTNEALLESIPEKL